MTIDWDDPTSLKALNNFAESPLFQSIRDSQKQHTEISLEASRIANGISAFRAAIGPLDEIRRATEEFNRQLTIGQEFALEIDAIRSFNEKFTLPDVNFSIELALRNEQIKTAAERYSLQIEDLAASMAAMREPWLEAENTLCSLTAFTEIQGIGKMIRQMPPFDAAVSSALRIDLGDWRDQISWKETQLTDIATRAELYAERGFNTALTYMPASGFQECTSIAGIRRAPPPPVALYYNSEVQKDDSPSEDVFARTNRAHDWIQRLESNLRQFIDNTMTAEFGHEWPKRQLPNGMYDQWKEKRDKLIKFGRKEQPIITYADFTDYILIITRKDNWNRIFQRFFLRREDIRESLQRLHPIRLDTMHSRPICQDDELLLYVELQRIFGVLSGEIKK